jgi:hypothetical protein
MVLSWNSRSSMPIKPKVITRRSSHRSKAESSKLRSISDLSNYLFKGGGVIGTLE